MEITQGHWAEWILWRLFEHLEWFNDLKLVQRRWNQLTECFRLCACCILLLWSGMKCSIGIQVIYARYFIQDMNHNLINTDAVLQRENLLTRLMLSHADENLGTGHRRAPIWAVHDNGQNLDSSKTKHFLIRNSVPGRICHQIKSSERTPFLDRQKKGMNTLKILLTLSRYCQGMRRYWDTGHVKFAFFNSIRFAIDMLTNRIWAYQVFWQSEGCERSIGHNCWNCKAIFHDVRPVEPSFGPSWAIDSQLRMWSAMGRACLWLYNAL